MHLEVSNHSTEPELVLEVGTIVDSRYRLDAVLGSGAMGTVYRGVHLSVGRPVALKVLSADLAASSTFRTRFRAEARAASAAGHPNIIEVFDAGELPDGRPYLVMEQLSGRELLEELRLHGPMTHERACKIVREVARALHAAHEVGIIHRDLKAENVFLVQRDEGETVKVLDFGIAHGGTDGQRVTTPGLAMGTPEYMAPEQAFGAPARPTFDIYALGVLLFELLVGEPPFVANNPMEVLGKKASNPAPSLGTRRRDLPDALVELVDACLEIEPDARPRSAEDVAHRLDAILVTAKAPPPTKKGLLETWGVVVSLAVVGVGVTGVLWAYQARDQGSVEVVEPVIDPVIDRASSVAVSAPEARTVEPLPPLPRPVSTHESDDATSSDEGERQTESPPTRSSARKTKVPRAVSDATPKPLPTSTKGAATADSSMCQLRRRQAHEARDSQDWEGVLRHTSRASCWASARERDKLRVKGYMETNRFDRCVELGSSSMDPEVRRWVQLCNKRMQ